MRFSISKGSFSAGRKPYGERKIRVLSCTLVASRLVQQTLMNMLARVQGVVVSHSFLPQITMLK
jgi:hypothetical protein